MAKNRRRKVTLLTGLGKKKLLLTASASGFTVLAVRVVCGRERSAGSVDH